MAWPEIMYVPTAADLERDVWVTTADDDVNWTDGAELRDSPQRDKVATGCGTYACLVGWVGLATADALNPYAMRRPETMEFFRALARELGEDPDDIVEDGFEVTITQVGLALSDLYEDHTWTNEEVAAAFERVAVRLGNTEDAGFDPRDCEGS